MKRVIKDCVSYYDTNAKLYHCQRIMLFRAILAFLMRFENVAEKTIHCFTVHFMVQMLVQINLLADEDKRIKVEVEGAEAIIERYEHFLPRWLVQAMKVYYLAVRPHFMVAKLPLGPFTRRFEHEDLPVVTEVLFVNSNGRKNFRASAVADQYFAAVSTFNQIPEFINIKPHSQIIQINHIPEFIHI